MRRAGRFATVLVAAALAVTAGLSGTPAAPAAPPVTQVKLHGVDLDTATVLDLQSDMDKHRFTSAQLTSFYLSRIQQLIPVLLKDNVDTGDKEHTTAGSFALLGDKPRDALLVTKLRAAGAVILGKAN